MEKFREYQARVENEKGVRIKVVQSDRGGEYINNEFISHLKGQGVEHQMTAPYTPEQNGVAERYNRTVVEIV